MRIFNSFQSTIIEFKVYAENEGDEDTLRDLMNYQIDHSDKDFINELKRWVDLVNSDSNDLKVLERGEINKVDFNKGRNKLGYLLIEVEY